MHLRRSSADYFVRLITPIERGGFWHLHGMGVNPPNPSTGFILDVAAQGFVAGGAWLVACPFCPSSQYGDPDIQDRFCCCECGNSEADHQWVQVEWPKEPAEIEAVLLKRRNPQRMNCLPGETLDDLYAENVAHRMQGLDDVPSSRRTAVGRKLAESSDQGPHVVAPGTDVHPDSELYGVDIVAGPADPLPPIVPNRRP